jgi:hypothetical protein
MNGSAPYCEHLDTRCISRYRCGNRVGRSHAPTADVAHHGHARTASGELPCRRCPARCFEAQKSRHPQRALNCSMLLPVPGRTSVGRCGAMMRPSGKSSPVSSKTTTPLHSKFHPCSGWAATIRTASRSATSGDGHTGRCRHGGRRPEEGFIAGGCGGCAARALSWRRRADGSCHHGLRPRRCPVRGQWPSPPGGSAR